MATLAVELVDEAEELVKEALVEEAAAEDEEEEAAAVPPEMSLAAWTPEDVFIEPAVLFM